MRDGNARPMTWIAGAGAISLIAVVAFLAGSYTSASAPAPANSVAAPTPAATATDALPPAAAASASTPAIPPVPQTPPVPLPEKPPTLAERIAASEDWLKNTPDTHYFIQLLSTDGNNARDVEIFLENNTGGLDPQQIRVYRSSLSGRERLGVIYGDYASREAANPELTRLAKANPASKPYVRSVSKLR
jgi:septal ring-binding cell division protein DamX